MTDAETPMEGPPAPKNLAHALEILANENRLEILGQLRIPRTVTEIELRPPSARAGENPDRAISRQAVRVHLQKLAELGLVVSRRSRRGLVVADEFTVNRARLYALMEEIRELTVVPANQGEFLPQETLVGAPSEAPARGHVPRLVIAKGIPEGRAFALTAAAAEGASRGWVIGRKVGLAVTLDYDAFVSSQNSEITLEGGGYRLHDLRSNRNGTYLNWRKLDKGATVPLAHGDVISVGRSVLVFRTD